MGWLLQMWNIWFALGHQLQIFIGDMYFPVCWSEFCHSHSVRCRALGAAIMSCSSSKIWLRVWRQFVCLMSIFVGGFAAGGGAKLLIHWDRGHSKGSSLPLFVEELIVHDHPCLWPDLVAMKKLQTTLGDEQTQSFFCSQNQSNLEMRILNVVGSIWCLSQGMDAIGNATGNMVPLPPPSDLKDLWFLFEVCITGKQKLSWAL